MQRERESERERESQKQRDRTRASERERKRERERERARKRETEREPTRDRERERERERERATLWHTSWRGPTAARTQSGPPTIKSSIILGPAFITLACFQVEESGWVEGLEREREWGRGGVEREREGVRAFQFSYKIRQLRGTSILPIVRSSDLV